MKRTWFPIAIVSFFCFCIQPLAGQEWNYPKPDPDRDVKDISFYQPADENWRPVSSATGQPRRIIVCIGDGMGFVQVQLARQRAIGADGRLYMEYLPFTGIMRTHAANDLVTDSAAAGTAMACGIKTDNRKLGMTSNNKPQQSILELLAMKGWRTGLVSTSSVTHATPAAFSAHVEERGMEPEIAAQQLAGPVDVMFGGGRSFFAAGKGSKRKDGRDLIAEGGQMGVQFIYSRDQLAGLIPGPRVIGLFADGGLTTYAPEPMLDEMTAKAIELLSAKCKEWFAPEPRFFLMVEGSQIDWACHANDADTTIRQTLLFDLAVKEAVEFAVKDRHTLVIVTADHETGGLTLPKKTPGELDIKWSTGGHSAGDVPIFAYGPGAERFTGVLDNTDLFVRLVELTGVKDPRPARQADAAGASR
jgi:alkaline phosphatase